MALLIAILLSFGIIGTEGDFNEQQIEYYQSELPEDIIIMDIIG